MNTDGDEILELEDIDIDSSHTVSKKSSLSSGLLSKASITFRHIKVMESLKYSRIPTVILDIKLNILWENISYQSLFLSQPRKLPVNIANDFSPFITTKIIGNIYRNLIDKEGGYSYKVNIISKHRDRLDITANLIITPFSDKYISMGNNTVPQYFIGIFDDISEGNKFLLEKTFLSLLEASKLKDNDTGNHIKRVGEYSRFMVRTLFNNPGYPEINIEFIENIYFLAPMHDVGKIGTPDYILTKPGALNKSEWEIMKEHTINGAYILRAYPDPMATQISTFHHEKWNGNGYPYGISGKDIPLAARIVAIADVYDALRMKRSYKEPFSHSKAMNIIKKDSGTHFDPELVKIFISINSEFETAYKKLIDS